jgi:Protein of unknown function (DUF3159)
MAVHREAPPATLVPETGWAAVKQTWSDPDRWIGIGVATAPGVVFVVVAAHAGLGLAVAAAGATAVVGLAVRLARRSSVRSALVGILVVAVCAVVATLTGEARGFFLLPAMVPFAVVAVCLATLVARRPLTGLLLNKVTGGPAEWYRDAGLRRLHTSATWVAVGINVVNAAIQVVFYAKNDTAVLAVTHVATGPIFATLVAVTIVAVRRTLAARR